MSIENARFDSLLGMYLPAIPEPFHGRLKWWHLRTHYVCMECLLGFSKIDNYQRHWAFNHAPEVGGGR